MKRIDVKGRVAALEILVVTPAIANLIREAKTYQIPGMLQVGKKYGMQTLDDAIMDLHQQGMISPEDAYSRAIDKKKFRASLEKSAGGMAMTKAELDYILGTMLDSHKDVSDLNFTVEKPLQVEAVW